MNKCISCHKKLGLLSKKILVYEPEDEAFQDDFWRGYVCSEECKKEILERAEKDFEEDIPKIKEHSKEYLCESCDYEWLSKKSFGNPAICPKCKSKKIIKYALTKKWENEYRKYKKNHLIQNLDNL